MNIMRDYNFNLYENTAIPLVTFSCIRGSVCGTARLMGPEHLRMKHLNRM